MTKIDDYVESWEIGDKKDKSPSHRVRIFTEERVLDAIKKHIGSETAKALKKELKLK